MTTRKITRDPMIIPVDDQEDIMDSFWFMMMECESRANDNNDRILKHYVEGWYRQWNRIYGKDLKPRWAMNNEN